MSNLSPARKLHDLLAKFDTAMLISRTPEGQLRGRPMAVAHVDEDCQIWFFSSIESGKVHEIECDSHVSVVCQRHDLFLSLSGQAGVSRERAKMVELWKESFKPWFPRGPEDDGIALVSVKPSEGEYWDGEGFNKIKYLFQTAHAFATGSPIRIEEGEQHAKVHLS